jgi:hypothetical protein
MKWITRSDIKVDRVACPWLIRKFVDPQAEFLFVPESELLTRAKQAGAIPFDAPRLPEVQLNHRGERCTFEAFVEDYDLKQKVTGIARLALIVRAADIKGQENAAPEGLGLRAIAEGFSLLRLTDEEKLARGFPIYDALYEYAKLH